MLWMNLSKSEPFSLVDDMANSRPSAQQIKLLINQLKAFFPKHCSMHIQKYIVNDLDEMLAISWQALLSVQMYGLFVSILKVL
jgi:hypothetical protein